MTAISVHNLYKHYGDVAAVEGVSFEVAEGEVYALLGHNGAGKSTTVEILEGFRAPSSGEVRVLGFDPSAADRRFRDRIGIVLQSSGVEPELTVREAIELYGSAYERRRPVDELIGVVGLDDKVDARIGTLSGGQRRRLDLALGIVGYPDVVFLDEPTTGFDPAARRKSWELVRGLCELGTTVLLTTHYLDEAEHLADRVGMLTRGTLVAEGSPDELIGRLATTLVSFTVAHGTADDLIDVLPDHAVVERGAESCHVSFATPAPTVDTHRVTSWAVERGLELSGLSVTRPSLEDVFLDVAETGIPTAGHEESL